MGDNVLDQSEETVFEEYSKEKGVHDRNFQVFKRFAMANNGHIIRYKFGGQPLWFCTPGKMNGPPPACSACGGKTVFEFQIQPMLIAPLKGTDDLADRLDFGTIACFACEESCSIPEDVGYVEEF